MRTEGLAAALALAAAAVAAHEAEPSRFSYHRDVAPILARHCLGCHRAGGLGPMSLESYRAVLPWGAAIRREVLERRMPPWQPEEGVLSLRGARLLSATEIDVLADWVTGAMPEGDAPSGPPSTAAVAERSGLPAQLVLAPEAGVRIGADEPERVECVTLAAPLGPTQRLRRLQFEPGNQRVVRRAVIWLGPECAPSLPPLHVWVPGQAAWQRPEGRGEPLAEGAHFAMRIEYQKRWEDDGVALLDASSLLLWFADSFGHADRAFVGAASLTLADESELLGWLVMEARDGPLRLRAVLPGGEARLLFEVRSPDRLWLGRYEPAEALSFPAGTTLSVSGGELVIELTTGGL